MITLTADDYKVNVDFLKEQLNKWRRETGRDSDRIFLLSLHPATKQLSPSDNMDLTVDIPETLQRKL
jgi:hypothetical protein